MANQKNIFISYSRKDKEIVDEVVGALENAGLKCWVDLKDLKGGDEWLKKIANKIDSADYFVPFLSANSIESENVRNEITYALNTEIEDRNKDFCVIPIKLDDSKLPKEIILGLGRYQQINYTDDCKSLCNQVVRAILPEDLLEIESLMPRLEQSLFNVELLAQNNEKQELEIDHTKILNEAESIFADTLKNSKYISDENKPRYNIAVAASYLYYSNYLQQVNQKQSEILSKASTIVFKDNIKKDDSSLYDYITKKSLYLCTLIDNTEKNINLQFQLMRHSWTMAIKCTKKSKCDKDFVGFESLTGVYLQYYSNMLTVCRYIKFLDENPDFVENVEESDLLANKWLYPAFCDDYVAQDVSKLLSTFTSLFCNVYFQSENALSKAIDCFFVVLLSVDGLLEKIETSEKMTFFVRETLVVIGSIESLINDFFGSNSDEMFIIRKLKCLFRCINEGNHLEFFEAILSITSNQISYENWLKRDCICDCLPILIKFYSVNNDKQTEIFLDSVLKLTKTMRRHFPTTMSWVYFLDRKLLSTKHYDNQFSYKLLCVYKNIEDLFRHNKDYISRFLELGLIVVYCMMIEYISRSLYVDAEFCCYRICKYISNYQPIDNKKYSWLLNKVGYILKWMDYRVESLNWFPANLCYSLDDDSLLTKIFKELANLSNKVNNVSTRDVEVVTRIFGDWGSIFSCDETTWYYPIFDNPANIFMTKMAVIFAYLQESFPDIVISYEDDKNSRIMKIFNKALENDDVEKIISALTIKKLPKYWICHNVDPFDFETVNSWDDCLVSP